MHISSGLSREAAPEQVKCIEFTIAASMVSVCMGDQQLDRKIRQPFSYLLCVMDFHIDSGRAALIATAINGLSTACGAPE